MGNETVKFWNAVMANEDYRAAHKKKRRTRIWKDGRFYYGARGREVGDAE